MDSTLCRTLVSYFVACSPTWTALQSSPDSRGCALWARMVQKVRLCPPRSIVSGVRDVTLEHVVEPRPPGSRRSPERTQVSVPHHPFLPAHLSVTGCDSLGLAALSLGSSPSLWALLHSLPPQDFQARSFWSALCPSPAITSPRTSGSSMGKGR